MFHVFKPRQLLVCLHKCHRMHKLKYAVSNMICKIDDSLLKSLKILDNSLKYLFSFDIKIGGKQLNRYWQIAQRGCQKQG